MSDKLVALDAEDRSVSVAEARHLARTHFLLRALDTLFELGMNPENKPPDRIAALKFVVDFAAEAQGNGSKQVGKLSPQAARLIAKLGLKPSGRDVPPDAEEGKRLGPGKVEPEGGESAD